MRVFKKKLFSISEATDVIQLCPLCLYKFCKVFLTRKVSLALSNHSISSAKSRKRTVQVKFQIVKYIFVKLWLRRRKIFYSGTRGVHRGEMDAVCAQPHWEPAQTAGEARWPGGAVSHLGAHRHLPAIPICWPRLVTLLSQLLTTFFSLVLTEFKI